MKENILGNPILFTIYAMNRSGFKSEGIQVDILNPFVQYKSLILNKFQNFVVTRKHVNFLPGQD